MKILVSACLLGENCKYDGGNNFSEKLRRLIEKTGAEVLGVCPEVLGGLPIPRIPSEMVDGKVMHKAGISVDAEFHAGAENAFAQANTFAPDLVVLQSRSPSCGAKEIYDGTFSGKLISGKGVFATMMIAAGYHVIDAEEL